MNMGIFGSKRFMMKIEAIFFDRGNTTNNCKNGPDNTEKTKIRNDKMATSINNIFDNKFATNEIDEMIINPWYDTFKERDSRGYELKLEDYVSRFLSGYDFDYNDKTIKEIITEYAKPHIAWDIPNDGIARLLKEIKKRDIKVGILSNSAMPGYAYEPIFNHYGLSEFIDDYVFSYDVKMRKPDAEIFKLACNRLTVDPTKSIMVGDKVSKDVVGAKKIGMKTVWYNFKKEETEHGADWMFHDFSEMLMNLDEIIQ